MDKFYTLPDLPYGNSGLEPVISEKQLVLHHDKHHRAYVDGANEILEKMDKARADDIDFDVKAMAKALSFNIGGHVLHSLFWENLAPVGKGGEMSEELKVAIEKDFGSVHRFKQEFSEAGVKVEGSGWAVMTKCRLTDRIMIMQIEKHNVNVFPDFKILMVLDAWEHAYYLDYKNKRAEYVERFWEIVNWDKVYERFVEV